MNINKLLVKRLQISTQQSIFFIDEKAVLIDGIIATQKQLVTKNNVVVCNDILVQDVKQLFYFAYHKPRGIESTQSKSIPNNLSDAVDLNVEFFPLGRLDKESEGLMILTNDGSIYREVTSSKVDKEYIVEVNEMLTDEVILKLSNGIEIMGVKTKPAIVELIDTFNFRIILRQGLNRQIRRMCYKLGYNVLSLKRIRIGNVFLDNLVPNAKREIYKNDLLITNS